MARPCWWAGCEKRVDRLLCLWQMDSQRRCRRGQRLCCKGLADEPTLLFGSLTERFAELFRPSPDAGSSGSSEPSMRWLLVNTKKMCNGVTSAIFLPAGWEIISLVICCWGIISKMRSHAGGELGIETGTPVEERTAGQSRPQGR